MFFYHGHDYEQNVRNYFLLSIICPVCEMSSAEIFFISGDEERYENSWRVKIKEPARGAAGSWWGASECLCF